MSGCLADCSQERKVWQHHCSALDGINGRGGRRMYTCRPDSTLHQTQDHPAEKQAERQGLCAKGRREFSTAGNITTDLVVDGNGKNTQ